MVTRFVWAFVRIGEGSLKTIQVNPNLANKSIDNSWVSVFSYSSASLPKLTLSAADPDLGPYCFFNKTSHTMMTSAYVTSGFVVSNSDCMGNCDLAGCSKYRLDSYSPLSYSSLSTCLVAEAFHYAISGSRKEIWCPWYSLEKSVFSYRGKQYNIQWYWLGWGTSSDCMNAIMCGPSSVFFDNSQTESLAWCQPVPNGYYSEQCSNGLHACRIPEICGGGMSLAFWTSHGYGSPTGCGVRLVCPASQTGFDLGLLTSYFSWTVSVVLRIMSPLIPSSSDVIFGSFPTFAIGVTVESGSSVRLRIFHSMWTVSSSNCWLLTDPIRWFVDETRTVSVSFSNQKNINVYIDNKLVSTFDLTPSTASIGTLVTGEFHEVFGSGSVHIGQVFASPMDFAGSTTSAFPYSMNSPPGLNFALSNLTITAQSITTTTSTLAPTFSTFLPRSTTTTTCITQPVTSSTWTTSEVSSRITNSWSLSIQSTFSDSVPTVTTQSSTITYSLTTSAPAAFHDSKSISSGGIAGIVIAAVLVLSAAGACIASRMRRRFSGPVQYSPTWMLGSDPNWFEEPSIMIFDRPTRGEEPRSNMMVDLDLPATEAADDNTFVYYF